jgi:CO/xanthine dehydrogenase Mo-binding subunit
MPGVRAVVREGRFLGVVAGREEQAVQAMKALVRAARWEEADELPEESAIHAFLQAQPTEDEILYEKSAARAAMGQPLAATYTRPYLAHASIGPSCAIAWWRAGKLEVWSHSQAMHALRDELAKILRLPAEDVVARHAEGAGCYGHNGADDVALDAALLARAVNGSPVRVQWMREDEFAWEPFGPAMAVKLQGALDGKGSVAEWRQEIWGNRHLTRPGRHPNPGLLAAWHLERGYEPPPAVDMPLAMGGGSQRNAVPYYDFRDARVVNHVVKAMPLRVSTLRALGAYLNVFAIESFMDELAHAADADPVEFRLRHLKDERAREVIRAVARAAGWNSRAKGGCDRRRSRRGGSRARAAHRGRDRLRARRQPGRCRQPGGGRRHPGGELDAQGTGAFRPRARDNAQLGRLSDPYVRGGALGRGRSRRPPSRALARGGRGHDGADRGRHRQRGVQRDGRARARPAAHARARRRGDGRVDLAQPLTAEEAWGTKENQEQN